MTAHGDSPDQASFEPESFERKLIEGLWNPLPDLCTVISERTDLDAVRAAAIRALGEIGDLDALPALMAVARNAHVAVRLAAIETLERLDLDSSVTKDIGEIIRAEPSARLRARAEEMLRRMNHTHNVEDNDAN